MKDRILRFLTSEGISPAEFADKIGVQRSSMSHILNGRNHPSAAFIQKMLQAYPVVNSRWLLIGDGAMNLSLQENKLKESVSTNEAPKESLSEPEFYSKNDLKQIANHTEKLEAFLDVPIQSDHAEKVNPAANPGDVGQTESLPLDVLIGSHTLVDEPKKIVSSAVVSDHEKEIEQILFFYKDKTFKCYKPT